MNNFRFYAPTEVVFGKGTEDKTGKQVRKWGGSRVLIVFGGGSVKRSGLLDKVEASLDAEGIAWKEYGGVVPNPRLAFAEQGVCAAQEFGADFILAVGGGSAIDTAKGIAHGTANPDKKLWDIWTLKTPLEKTLPIGVVLTIPAAGSEMSNSAVLTNVEEGRKVGLTSDMNRVKFSIMNPEYCMTLPKWQIACGVADIMMHTMERYFIPGSSCGLTDEIAEGVLRTVTVNGSAVMEDPNNYDAMAEVMWCGSISHNTLTDLGRGGDFIIHKLGHTFSADYDSTHGASLTALWGSWAKYIYKDEPKRFARYASQVWGVSGDDDCRVAEEGIRRTVSYFKSLGLPVSIHELIGREITDAELDKLAMDATMQDQVKLCRIRPLGAKEVREIFEMAK